MTAVRLAGLSLVAATGIAGLSADPRLNLHAAFGVLLLAMVAAGVHKAMLGNPPSEAEARALSRRLSRTVYLILYLVLGVDRLLRECSDAAVLQPPERLRDYFLYGLAALLAIRVLTILSVRRPRALRMSPQLGRAVDAAAPQ